MLSLVSTAGCIVVTVQDSIEILLYVLTSSKTENATKFYPGLEIKGCVM